MSTDYAAKERAFLDSLKPDTGRDLAEWMQAIAAADLPHRNDTIDWLRQQGFPFSRASWLERIHHNGGRPIYAGVGNRPPATRRSKPAPAGPEPRARVAAQAAPAGGGASSARPASGNPAEPTLATAATAATAGRAGENATPAGGAPAAVGSAGLGKTEVAALLAPAKAYRPLAQYLIAAIERAIPGLTISAGEGLLILAAPRTFAAILPGPRDIRLGLDAGDAALGAHMLRARLPGAPPALAHTIVLSDARQVNAELVAIIDAARRRSAGAT